MGWLPERWPRWQRWLVRVMILALVLILLVAGLLLWIEWRPPDLQKTPVHRGGDASTKRPRSITVLSWNIGYAGLGREADFFMDGGKQVRPPSRKGVRRNLAMVKAYLKAHPADVILLQEVDSNASRTFSMNQVADITRAVPGYAWSRALNFKVPWIPVPIFEPLGRVESGLLSLTRYRQTQALRHQLPGKYAWPVRVFHLKRCLHEVRFKAADDRDWVLLHVHLSAFDKGGALRKQQMAYLKRLMLRIHQQGHHVTVAGDWNHAPPGVDAQSFPHHASVPKWFQKVPAGWTPSGWQWVYDKKVPSLRTTNRPYTPGRNFVTTVDAFLVAPGLRVDALHTTDLGFRHSDHHPIHTRLSLKK